MQTFDQAIFKLYKDGLISYDDAIQAVTNPDEFKLRLVGIEQTAERGWGQFEKKDKSK
jgi:twitching motility protein PilT